MISKEINIQDIYTLSHTQEGMLYHSIYSPDSDVYTQQIDFTLRGNLDKSLFIKAWQMVIDRHPILRTVFDWSTREKPLQIVYKTIPFPFEFKDWQDFTLDEQADNLRSLLVADLNKGFDLSKTPLIRLILIQMSKEKFQFIWTSHHIILDGWSVFLILKDLFSLYEALILGGELYLKPCPPYKNFIAWLKKQNLQEAEKFWKKRLNGFKTPTQLWITKSPADAQNRSQSFNDYIGKISSELTLELKSFAKEYQLTINTLIQGIWALMISKYSGEDDVLFGTTVSGRREPEDVDKMVGLFINTLPVRFQINKDDSIISWLKKNQYEQVETIQYDFSPLVQIHQWSEVPNDQPLFDQILVFENYPIDDYFSSKERIVGIESIDSVERTNYSLTVIVSPDKELEVKCIYDKNKFEQKTIENLIIHFQTILEGIIKNPTLLIKQLQILSCAEHNKILVEWNQTRTEFPYNKCLHQLFQEQARRTPNSIAVAFDNETLTYSKLNQKSDQLARHLVSLGVNSNELVAILLDRSINMMVALLGVLKAGGAYLPLDPEFPYERLEFMLEDAQVKTLLTQTNFLDNLPSCSAEIVCIDDYSTNPKFEDIINDQVNSENLAYIIYTSGSTGKPKGVQVTHKSVVNFLSSMTKKPGFNEEDILLAVTTLSFDISILELFLPIINGGKTIIASKDIVANGEQLLHTLEKHRVNVMQATPTTWRLLIEAGWKGNKNFKVLCGGEAVSNELADKLLSRSSNVWNMYGPTETTVWSTCHKLEKDSNVLIGTPIDNTMVYVLDNNMQTVPIGVPGELYIGGDGVSKGYFNRPDLTSERFIINPFIKNTLDKIYKTGDLVRFNQYGKLEFLNRIDQQVKIRGFRIELGEIEKVLAELESINMVAVTAYEHQKDDTRLVAYIVLNSSNENSEENRSELVTQLRDFVKKKLPAYMIPTSFIFLEKLPLTPNGKIDRKALPKPDQSIYGLENNYVAPQNETEEKLVEIWKKVLHVEKVGVNDNFFELGGHSLLAVYLFNQIELNFNKKLPLALLFEAPTIAKLYEHLTDNKSTTEWSLLVPIQPNGSKPPLFLIHGAGGNILLYRSLSQHLGPDQPVYGLQARGLDGREEFDTEIESMALDYIKEIKSVQPQGPYFLGGYCMGGTVAYEMAQQLVSAGQEVALVALLETYNPQPLRKTNSFAKLTFYKFQNYWFHLENLLSSDVGGKAVFFKEKAKVELERMKLIIQIGLYKIGNNLKFNGKDLAPVIVDKINDNANNEYVPKSYPGHVTVFKPKKYFTGLNDSSFGWRELVKGGVQVCELDVSPRGMLVEPFVKDLAQRLRSEIKINNKKYQWKD